MRYDTMFQRNWLTDSQLNSLLERRMAAVEELAFQEAQHRHLDEQRSRWVVQSAKVALVRGGSAWRAIRTAADYADRLTSW